MKVKNVCLIILALLISTSCKDKPGNSFSQLPVLKRANITGFSNGGWKYDRYKNLESLDAGKSMVVADLKGPGMITHIDTTRHTPE